MRYLKYFCMLVAGAIMTIACANNDPVEDGSMSPDIFIKEPTGGAVEPSELLQTSDKNFVIVGQLNVARAAWVDKVDAQGHVIWSYRRGFDAADAEALKNKLAFSPKFHSIAQGSDGTFTLCGQMQRALGSREPTGLITRLSAQGEFLEEKYFTPRIPGYVNTIVDRCRPWNDNTLILSHSIGYQSNATQTGTQSWKNLYSISLVDSKGHTLWLRELPSLENNFTPFNDEITLDIKDQWFAITAGDNTSTEIITMTMDGTLLGHRSLNGRFTLVQSSNNDSAFEILGIERERVAEFKRLIEYSPKIEEKSNFQITGLANFFAQKIFRSEKSLFLMGTATNGNGGNYRSAIRVLNHARIVTLQRDLSNIKYFDRGVVSAGTPLLDGAVVIARTFAFCPVDGKDNGERGTVLNFIKTTN